VDPGPSLNNAVANPTINTIRLSYQRVPHADETLAGIAAESLHPCEFLSIAVRKWIVSSTAIPKQTVNAHTLTISKLLSKSHIIAPVIASGQKMLGMNGDQNPNATDR